MAAAAKSKTGVWVRLMLWQVARRWGHLFLAMFVIGVAIATKKVADSATEAATTLVENTAGAATLFGSASILRAATPHLAPLMTCVWSMLTEHGSNGDVRPYAISNADWRDQPLVLAVTSTTAILVLVQWVSGHGGHGSGGTQ